MLIKMLTTIFTLSFLICNIGYSKCLVLEFKNAKNEFTIVVVKDPNNQKNAKLRAINRAAIIAKSNGFKSFDITNEENVEVMLGKNNWPNAYDFEQNLYQEEIVEKGFNRERIISQSILDFKLRDAYKIKIKCFGKSNGSYRVCEIIK